MDTPTSEKSNLVFFSGKIFQMLLSSGFILFHLIIVPLYMDHFEKMGADIPKLTHLMFLITDFLRHQWFFALPLFACMLIFEGLLIRKYQRAGYDKMNNTIPWLASIIVLIYLAVGSLAVYLPFETLTTTSHTL